MLTAKSENSSQLAVTAKTKTHRGYKNPGNSVQLFKAYLEIPTKCWAPQASEIKKYVWYFHAD